MTTNNSTPQKNELDINNIPGLINSVEITKFLTWKINKLLNQIFNETSFIKNNKINDRINLYKIIKDFENGKYTDLNVVGDKYIYISNYIKHYDTYITNITCRIFNSEHYDYINNETLKQANEILLNLPAPKYGDTNKIMIDKLNEYDYTFMCFDSAFKMEKLKLL
jgi:hypothetical protein